MTHAQKIALDRMLDAIGRCCTALQDRATAVRLADLRLRLAGLDPADVARTMAPACEWLAANP